MMVEYEIVNPSDYCTLLAPNDAIAAVAILCLGEGKYGATRLDGNEMKPTALFQPFGGSEDGLKKWSHESLGCDFSVYFKEHEVEIAAALASAIYGKRSIYEAGIYGADEPRRKAFAELWEDEHRTSMNMICKRAHWLAKNIREK